MTTPTTADDLLRPFAAMGGDWAMPPFHDLEADIVVWQSAGRCVTAGDVRAARRYLDGRQGEPDPRPAAPDPAPLDADHPDCGDRCACYVRGVDDEAEATRD